MEGRRSADARRERVAHPGRPATRRWARMMRRYWLPALLGDEVAEPDGTPVRVRLLGEDLVAFRDTAGRLGLRRSSTARTGCASLALGRNEECGLRCIYHGWKFDVDGSCIDMPTEPEGYGFSDRMRMRAYPVREAGGIVWTYLGPPGAGAAVSGLRLDGICRATQRARDQVRRDARTTCRRLEGAIDSAHSWFLHRGVIRGLEEAQRRSRSTSRRGSKPRTRRYGFRYAAIRRPNANPDREKYVRVTLYVVTVDRVHPAPARSERRARARPDLRPDRRRAHDALRRVLQPERRAGRRAGESARPPAASAGRRPRRALQPRHGRGQHGGSRIARR